MVMNDKPNPKIRASQEVEDGAVEKIEKNGQKRLNLTCYF
jgi:hypothetical protein